jgi:hypothetical protein
MIMKSVRQPLTVMICLLALLANSTSLLAQGESPTVKKRAPVETDYQMEMKLFPEGTFKLFDARFFGKVVKGAPYSATAITEQVQTLGDGNQIIRKNEAKLYRDSEGRTRREQKLETIGKWTAAGEAPQLITISDPVAGYSYNLDPRTRTARKGAQIKSFDYRQKIEEVNEKRVRETEERGKRNEERIKRDQEQVRERLEHLKEQHKEREKRDAERVKERTEQLKERQVRMKEEAKEREAQMKERAKEREEREKEWTKEREAQEKEHLKEREERLKERTKEHEKRLTEMKKEREERVKELTKEREKREKEHIERSKRIEKQHEEIEKLTKEKIFAPGFALKPKESMVRKDISNSDGKKKIDALGKQVIEGVEVEGTRSTRTISAGEIGNTLPIEIVDENWYSQELQLQVMTKHSDPRNGVTTYRLTQIRRGEPDRSLFEVPADYTFRGEPMPRKPATKPEPANAPQSAKPIDPSKKPAPPKAPRVLL